MTRILVTGSRAWKDRLAIAQALVEVINERGLPITIVHGGNQRGADQIVDDIARSVGLMDVEVHPALWEKHGKAAGPIRNQEMVDAGADVCLAFPMGESRGTRDCMRRAEAAGIPVINYEPRFLWCRICKRDYLVHEIDAHTHINEEAKQ
jgi:hypothetical protein